jgi:hypothetical protein
MSLLNFLVVRERERERKTHGGKKGGGFGDRAETLSNIVSFGAFPCADLLEDGAKGPAEPLVLRRRQPTSDWAS